MDVAYVHIYIVYVGRGLASTKESYQMLTGIIVSKLIVNRNGSEGLVRERRRR